MPTLRHGLPLCLALLFACAPASAQTQTPPQQQQTAPPPASGTPAQPSPAVGEAIDEDDVLRIDSNLVSIPAVVTESTGRPVPDLRLEDFELRVDGQPRPIGELNRADAPVVLAVLFDNSSSLSKAREFEKQAATRFFRRIVRPIDKAAIYSISTVPVLARPLTNNVGVLVRSIESFPAPEGATALFDTISEAANYLSPFEARKVLVLVTDGNDTISDKSFDQALQRALKSDCQIYVVGTGDLENPNFNDTIALRRLQVFAAQTGGAVYVPRAVEDLDAAFEQIFKDISQQYVLSYYPTEDPADGRFRTIDLRVKTRPTLRVRAREGYYANVGQANVALTNASQPPVRPRRATGERDVAAGRSVKAGAARGPAERQQSATLDPLYAQPTSAAPRRTPETDPAVTFRAKAPAAVVTLSRSGPQEHFEPAEPERVSVINRTTPGPNAELKVVPAATHAPSAPPAAATPPNATTQPPADPKARQSVSTLEAAAEPSPAPAKTDSNKNEPAKSESAKPEPSRTEPRRPVTGGVLNGQAKNLPRPIYPQAARTAGITGRVTVEVEIDEQGKVASAKATEGHALLQQAAVIAARLARFSPTLLSGSPIRIKGFIVYNFLGDK
jgi:Ca-activated chloride channel family protein